MKPAKRIRYVTVAKNIYRYPDGHHEAKIELTGCPTWRKHFAAEIPLATIEAEVTTKRTELEKAKTERQRSVGELKSDGRKKHAGRTLELDAPDFLDQIKAFPRFKADRSHLRAWFDVVVDGRRLGDMPRATITTRHINLAIVQWSTRPSPHAVRTVRVRAYDRAAAAVVEHTIKGTTVKAHARGGSSAGHTVTSYTREGSTVAAHTRAAATVQYYERRAPITSGHIVKPLTIRHRCRLLAELYHTLDGATKPTPVDEAKVPTRPKSGIPITVPLDIVENTLRKLAHLCQKTYARFAVVATCGQRPCQVARAQPDDVDITNGVWIVRDAKGEEAHPITLDEAQRAAWEVFFAVDAWGAFDTTKYGRLIHEAGWPKGITPYKARHTFARAAIKAGINLGDLQGQLGHTDPKTTRIYAPFVVDQQRKVSKKMKHYLLDALKPKPRLVKR